MNIVTGNDIICTKMQNPARQSNSPIHRNLLSLKGDMALLVPKLLT